MIPCGLYWILFVYCACVYVLVQQTNNEMNMLINQKSYILENQQIHEKTHAMPIYESMDKCGVNKKITNFQSKALRLSRILPQKLLILIFSLSFSLCSFVCQSFLAIARSNGAYLITALNKKRIREVVTDVESMLVSID